MLKANSIQETSKGSMQWKFKLFSYMYVYSWFQPAAFAFNFKNFYSNKQKILLGSNGISFKVEIILSNASYLNSLNLTITCGYTDGGIDFISGVQKVLLFEMDGPDNTTQWIYFNFDTVLNGITIDKIEAEIIGRSSILSVKNPIEPMDYIALGR
jgi:hypothetical protein